MAACSILDLLEVCSYGRSPQSLTSPITLCLIQARLIGWFGLFLNSQLNLQTNQLNTKMPTLLHFHPSHALLTKWSDFGCEKSIPLISRHRAATKPKTPQPKPFNFLLHPINKNPEISSSKPPFLIPGKQARLHTSTSTSATAFVIFKNQATIRSFKLHTSRRLSSVFSAFAFLTCH